MKEIILTAITISILSCGCVRNAVQTKADTNASAEISVQQEQQNPIDKAEEDCMSKNSSTQGMNECTFKAEKAWEKEIDKYLALLKNITSKENFENIQLTQKNWEIYRDSELAVYNLVRQKQGTMFQNVTVGFQRNLIKQRALELKELYDNLIYE